MIDFVKGVLLSISQVFLKGSAVAALLLLAGLAVSSLWAAAFALGGAILAVATAHLFGAESDLIVGGLLGFSPVLTAVALGATFHKPSLRVAGYAALATVFTVVAQAALNVASEAVRDSGADGAVHPGLMDVPAPAPVLRVDCGALRRACRLHCRRAATWVK